MNRSDNHIEKVPVGWDVKRFDDLLNYIQPTPYIVESTAYDDAYKTPVLTPGKSFIKGYTNESTGIFNSLPVIIFDDFTTANKFVNFPFKVKSSAMKILKPKDENVNIKYVFYYMQTVRVSYDTHKRYWISVFSKLPVPYPPKPTQEAIVSKIEELFSEIEKGIESLSTAKQQLKTYRQSVLKWAFEGKLTEEWRERTMVRIPAAPHEEKIAAEPEAEYKGKGNHSDINGHYPISDKGELPKEWKWVSISDIADVNPKLPNKENITEDLEIQFLPMKLVEEIVNKIHLDETKTFKEVQKKSYTPFINGDIIFAKVTPCMENGKIAIVEKLKNGIGYGSSEFHVLRCSKDALNKYVFYFLVQDKFRNQAQNAMTGAVGLRRVPKQFIENHSIPLPPINEQKDIIETIENRLSVADKMEESINESLQQAEALKQSILKKAFDGRLL